VGILLWGDPGFERVCEHGGVEERLESLSARCPWALSPDEVVAELDVLVPWIVRAEAALLARVREVEGRGIARRDGATSTTMWLRNRYLMGGATAWRYARLAAALGRAPDTVRDAVVEGRMNLDQAEVVMQALVALPPELGVEIRDRAAKELVRVAGGLEPVQLRTVGEAILQLVAPEVADEAGRKALERAEARAERNRGFTITPDASGSGFRVSGRLTNEGAATVRAAIEPLCHPARVADPADAAEAAADQADRAVPAATTATTATQRRADALVEVCRLALNTAELPTSGGDRPQVVVSVPYDVLARELGAGTLDNGDRVTPESARRMACDCRLLPIVFDGAGRPLDVGRSRRLVTGTLRQALVARDRGCTFPGCDRGPRWTDAHHVVPWAAGGPTALDNLALLCLVHHSEVHKPGGWTVSMASDGLPTFVPPRRLDPQQTPQRNRYHPRR
jgi:hypothetical protein